MFTQLCLAISALVAVFASPQSQMLGDSCVSNADCAQAYAVCANSTCSCGPGFSQNYQGTCSPTKISCPLADIDISNATPCTVKLSKPASAPPAPKLPVIAINATATTKSSTTTVKTTAKTTPTAVPVYIDSCNNDSYCFLDKFLTQTEGTGFCCKRPDVRCPVGEPDLTVTCSNSAAAPNKKPTKKLCNQSTHYCYSPSNNNMNQADTICCPRPCPTNTLYVNGTCYLHAKLGGSCVVNQQCPAQSHCSEDGNCICNAKYVDHSSGYCTEAVCPGPVHASSPLITNGTLLRCNNSDCPSSDFYCTSYTYMCCPLPGIKLCDPSSRNVKAVCGPGNSCTKWYQKYDVATKRNNYVGFCYTNQPNNTIIDH